MLLCESKIINKNPKYRIIKYNDEYLMIDIISTWISLFFPFINWFIPKRYVKISREEFENLSIVKPAKKNVFWPVAGISTLFAVTLRKYTHLLDTQLDKKLVIAICCITFIGILIFYVRLIKKSSLNIYNPKNERSKIILIPTLKKFLFHIIWIYFIWRIDYAIPRCTIINESPKHNSIFYLDCSYNGFFSSEYSFNHR